MKRRLPRILAALVIMLIPLALLRVPAVRAWLVSLIAFMQKAGPLGVAAFVGAELVATLMVAPMWLMSGVAGYAYGFRVGVFIAIPAITFCTCLSFLAGRFLLKRVLAARAEESRFLSAVERAVRLEGLKITLLLRFTFAFPQNLLSYLLAMTPLRLREFALGTFIGLIPATVFHVYLGSIVQSAAALVAGEGSARGPLGWATMVGGLVMTGTALAITSRVAKRALDRALAAQG